MHICPYTRAPFTQQHFSTLIPVDLIAVQSWKTDVPELRQSLLAWELLSKGNS